MIDVENDGPVWTLRINRPDKANSLAAEMLAELRDATRDAKGQARALILTGAGGVFSAGADLEAAKTGLATSPLWEELSGAIADFDGLSIAALNGTVAGGAFGMVLAADLRISVPTAKFFYPVMKLGFLPQPSDPVRMAELVGPARAKLILMAGQKVDAQTALAAGLVDEIVAPDTLLGRAEELVQDVLSATPAHATAIKRMIG